tara:strand:+ start:1755 stop:2036 length:282 start_codon:yes stop_codon:yes gene_type:complete
MLHSYRSDPFEDDKLYQVDGELLNMIVQLCKYFGRMEPESHSVINFVLSNLLQTVDCVTDVRWLDGIEDPELDDEEFRAEMKKLGVIVPRRSN